MVNNAGMQERHRELTEEDIAAIHYNDRHFDSEVLLGRFEPDNTVMDFLQRASYEIGDRAMAINDPVWGEEIIGDQPYDMLLIRLARTPVFRRLQSIEQLTLGPEHATMPNSMYFSRWQHIWGSLVFVRKMTENDPRLDDRQKIVLQLRTLLSDVGHTAFSHLGDWLFQGLDGGEDLHDQDLKDLLQVTGVEKLLGEYGLTVEETVFPEVEDWIECASPDICVDRVDYGLREMMRWASPPLPLHLYKQELHDPQSLFEITEDNQLVFRSQQMAKWFATGFSLLPTEHWSHPVHRLQLQLFQGAVQASTVDKTEFNGLHPREALYEIDNSFMSHFATWDMLHVQKVMKDIASTQRRIFITARQADLEHIYEGNREADWEFPSFPDPLQPYTWQSRKFGLPYSPQLDIQIVEKRPTAEAMKVSDRGLVMYLPPLKARAVDPPIRTEHGIVRLSDAIPSYATYLEEQRAMMARAYEATVLMRPDIAEKIVARHAETTKAWQELILRPRNKDELRRLIKDVEPFAAVHSFDQIREVDDEDVRAIAASMGKRLLRKSGLTTEQ